MDLNKKYVFISDDKTIEDESIIVHDLEENIIVLNEFECSLVRMFDGARTILEISKELSVKYGDSYNEIEFLNFTQELMDYGVINYYD